MCVEQFGHTRMKRVYIYAFDTQIQIYLVPVISPNFHLKTYFVVS